MPTKILEQVGELLEKRGKAHGDFRENFEMCAGLWSAYLQMPIAPAQVPVMMALLKFSRDQCGDHPDHLIDAVGYSVLASAIEREKSGCR